MQFWVKILLICTHLFHNVVTGDCEREIFIKRRMLAECDFLAVFLDFPTKVFADFALLVGHSSSLLSNLPAVYFGDFITETLRDSGDVCSGDGPATDFIQEVFLSGVAYVRLEHSVQIVVGSVMVDSFTAKVAATVEIPCCVISIRNEAVLNRATLDFFIPRNTTVPAAEIGNYDNLFIHGNVEVHAFIVQILVVQFVHHVDALIHIQAGILFIEKFFPIFIIEIGIAPDYIPFHMYSLLLVMRKCSFIKYLSLIFG
nr:MAG TPA: hypothetical protein [Caudoviricetes sp.]